MKTSPPLVADALALPRSRGADFLELTKPRIAVLVLFTVAIGALLASRGRPDLLILVNTLIGTGLVAAGASALNQFLERQFDGQMRRTENRPLPAGRILPHEALGFGLVLGLGGLVFLACTVRQPIAVGLTAFTLFSYVLLYTPLKRKTTLNTLIGAVPGALPPVLGWTAMTGSLDAPAVVLFLIVFLWQVPHFLAIAWIYREDYGRGGFLMLPVVDAAGTMTARQMLVYALALVPVSLCPVLWQGAGLAYAVGALVLGLAFAGAALGFYRHRTTAAARRVLQTSLVYLPAILALLLLENVIFP